MRRKGEEDSRERAQSRGRKQPQAILVEVEFLVGLGLLFPQAHIVPHLLLELRQLRFLLLLALAMEPLVFQCLLGRESVLRIHNKKVIDEILACMHTKKHSSEKCLRDWCSEGERTLSGNLIPVFIWIVILSLHDLLKHLWHSLGIEWRESAKPVIDTSSNNDQRRSPTIQ